MIRDKLQKFYICLPGQLSSASEKIPLEQRFPTGDPHEPPEYHRSFEGVLSDKMLFRGSIYSYMSMWGSIYVKLGPWGPQ